MENTILKFTRRFSNSYLSGNDVGIISEAFGSSMCVDPGSKIVEFINIK